MNKYAVDICIIMQKSEELQMKNGDMIKSKAVRCIPFIYNTWL